MGVNDAFNLSYDTIFIKVGSFTSKYTRIEDSWDESERGSL